MENRKWSTGFDDAQQARRLMSDWNPRRDSGIYHSEKNSSGHWTVWYNHPEVKDRKTIVLDGSRFTDIEGFYKEIDHLFRKNSNREIRHNMSTLNDLLRGGSRVMRFEEPVKLVWKNSTKSMKDLGLKRMSLWAAGESFYEVLLGIIGAHKHIELVLE
jgi:RNAse (barnase) inhibitor barstar